MGLELAKGNYVARIWFFYKPGGMGDFDVFAHLSRRLPEGPWILEYRFRYYEDHEAHGSKDRKSGYKGELDGKYSEAYVLERIEMAFRVMASALPEGFVRDETVVGTDDPKTIAALMSQKPYMHIKIGKIES